MFLRYAVDNLYINLVYVWNAVRSAFILLPIALSCDTEYLRAEDEIVVPRTSNNAIKELLRHNCTQFSELAMNTKTEWDFKISIFHLPKQHIEALKIKLSLLWPRMDHYSLIAKIPKKIQRFPVRMIMIPLHHGEMKVQFNVKFVN